jgi:alkylation response protein AidB-like acyl-CoA dehydrogenase
MTIRPLTASSSTSGFFQAVPTLPPQYTSPTSLPIYSQSPHQIAQSLSDDKVLARILDLYLPSDAYHMTNHVHHISRLALAPSTLKHSTDAETNHPFLRPLTTFGEENRNDPLWTTNGWQVLKDIGIKEGVVAVAYEKQNTRWNRRIYEFALSHVWGPTGTMTGCPMAMTDGAATLLAKHLSDTDGDQPGRGKVLEEAYKRLTSRVSEVAWTSGQWMTERTGGSDISGTETVARRLTNLELRAEVNEGREYDAVGMPLGPWKIDGFKWFSSATDSEMAVLLARTSKGGLSAFYAPMRRKLRTPTETIHSLVEEAPLTELNGVRIQRLKNKLGTKSLPTAEIELKGTRAWLVGIEGQGVKEISAILNITRLHTAAGSAGNWARGLAIARAYTRVRKVHERLLQCNPQHLRWMADETVKYRASAHFAFFGVALQGAIDQDWEEIVKNTKADNLIPKDKTVVQTLLRLLTPVMKAQVSVASVNGLRQCMECLGGVGYCENNEDGGLMNIAKIYRDNLVNPIWEGTVSVMADDVVRVLVDKRLGNGNVLENVFAPWVNSSLRTCGNDFQEEVFTVEARLESLKEQVRLATKETLLYRGREILEHIEAIVCSCLLMYDATVAPDEVAAGIASRWVTSKALGRQEKRFSDSYEKLVLMDRRIFLGDHDSPVQMQGKL